MALLGILLVAAAAGVTCDTFTPRVPPPPEQNICGFSGVENPQFIEPLSPEVLRGNVQLAFECPRTEFYEQSLKLPENGAPGFVYIPDSGADALAPGFFDGWDVESEVQFAVNLLDSPAQRVVERMVGDVAVNDTLLLELTTLEIPTFFDTGQLPGTNDARYEVEYELTLTFAGENGTRTELVEVYCGRAFWDLTGGDRNFWTLLRWEDLEPRPQRPCSETMGVLRIKEG
ncbi:MAG: hypothetical protein JSW67_12400 [Candidatus Latescibacterota bacterium]|nr:MAG: hypothetical protein JSW67_12400 [Candidatus Latescibacterota bacterium]